MTAERLQKVLAAAGVASRRAAEQLIISGRVQVNGKTVTELGTKVDPQRDRILVDGQPIVVSTQRVYFVLHKPKGVLTTAKDPFGRRTVMDLLPEGCPRVFPVGRLDVDSEGLLLLTNDGELAHALMHPRHGVEKEYVVEVEGCISPVAVRHLREGVALEEGRTRPAAVRVVQRGRDRTVLAITLREGRKRQIRRMCCTVGYPVVRLVRVRIGPLRLGGLAPGALRCLKDTEVAALRRAAGLTAGPTRDITAPNRLAKKRLYTGRPQRYNGKKS